MLPASKTSRIYLGVLIGALVIGTGMGYMLSQNNSSSSPVSSALSSTPKSAAQDNRTFKDFAEGTIQKRPAPKDPTQYQEGTHLLVRDGAMPVALTSSVVDLGQYEGKKVKVFGETQKAIKEGWLMDVGKVETE